MPKSELASHQTQLIKELRDFFPAVVDATLEQLARVASLSEYFHRTLIRYHEDIAELLESGQFFLPFDLANYQQVFANRSAPDLNVLLRDVRHIHMCRIIFRDLARIGSLAETVADLSCLADAAVETALEKIYRTNVEKFGTPTGEYSGKPQRMTVLALGKLGARELNLSSDIDLMFFYDEPGSVSGVDSQLNNQEFFLRVSRELIAALNNNTAHGFVFRVDMRLRPYGDSGSLILHRSAMEKYYLEQGRDWERYALIKARAIAGDLAHGADFLNWLVPFIYRRHLDYGAIESLRDMKRLINREVSKNSLTDDLKLGPGGIREIEFIVQAHQLIFAGTHKYLRESQLRPALNKLKDEGMLPVRDVDSLLTAYEFLRNSEHVVQAENDRQTQRLPETELSQARMAEAMGFDDFQAYREELERHRALVIECFAAVVTDSDEDRGALLEGNLHWQKIWLDAGSTTSLDLLTDSAYQKPESVVSLLESLQREVDKSDSQEIARERIDRLIPVMLSLAAGEETPDETLSRCLPIVEAVVRRSTYISFLLENLDALKRLINLCAMSPFVAERLATHPILLYGLTDRETQEIGFDRDDLNRELELMLAPIGQEDLESQMDILRQFKQSSVLKVAVYELLDLLPLMKASDALTYIAEIILEKAVELAWRHFVSRHGRPIRANGEPCDMGFAILAYGKLGGIELSYGSDLDLVFIHDADIHADTDGEKPVNTNTFYSRMGQRIIHILTSLTRFGSLYEIDLRLRPAGNKGPLVSSLSSFERYQRQEAWTWEHQALVRARVVAGDPAVGQRIELVRREVLSIERDRDQLAADVISMREKMREHLDPVKKQIQGPEQDAADIMASVFDLKHGTGAIVDIEFMVQYAVLGWAWEFPQLTTWSDKMRLLDELRDVALFSQKETELLQQAYLAYRSAVHFQWLGGQMASYSQLNSIREDVVNIWKSRLGQEQK